MLVRGNRGVTEGTPRSPFCSLYTAMMSWYRAVAKRRGAYAAMIVRSYRGVSGFYDLAIRPLLFCPATSSNRSVSRRREKKGRLRRDDRTELSRGNRRDPAIPFLFSLHRDDVEVSRRREKKGRLRRDDRTELSRGNQRADFGSPRSLAILTKLSDQLEIT